MQTTTNYGFNIVEGTDIVNPLTQLNPNFTSLDSDLKAVSDSTVDSATCIKTGTVHAITRTNTDAKVFRFTATGNWNTGDTMTVDGTLVSVYLTDGSSPSNGCFVINTEVIAAIQGTRVTLYVNLNNAANISFDDTSVSFTANDVQDAIEAVDTTVNALPVKKMLSGYRDIECLLNGTNYSETIPLSPAFNSTPSVMVSVDADQTVAANVAVRNISTNSVTLYAQVQAGAPKTVRIRWVAIGD